MEKTAFVLSPVLLPTSSFSFQATDAAAAIIVVDGDRYLLQHRDMVGAIVYPGYWGCFGGARDRGEPAVDALRREVKEEIGIEVGDAVYFTAVNYDFRFCGKGQTLREYYLVHVTGKDLEGAVLGEGQGMAVMTASEVFALRDIIPFDLFAMWLYINRAALAR